VEPIVLIVLRLRMLRTIEAPPALLQTSENDGLEVCLLPDTVDSTRIDKETLTSKRTFWDGSETETVDFVMSGCSVTSKGGGQPLS